MNLISNMEKGKTYKLKILVYDEAVLCHKCQVKNLEFVGIGKRKMFRGIEFQLAKFIDREEGHLHIIDIDCIEQVNERKLDKHYGIYKQGKLIYKKGDK